MLERTHDLSVQKILCWSRVWERPLNCDIACYSNAGWRAGWRLSVPLPSHSRGIVGGEAAVWSRLQHESQLHLSKGNPVERYASDIAERGRAIEHLVQCLSCRNQIINNISRCPRCCSDELTDEPVSTALFLGSMIYCTSQGTTASAALTFWTSSHRSYFSPPVNSGEIRCRLIDVADSWVENVTSVAQ